MKTKRGWDKSEQTLDKYLTIGEPVDGEMYDYFCGVLPPAMMTSEIVQIGEPFDCDGNGKDIYQTLVKKDGDWVYIGIVNKGN